MPIYIVRWANRSASIVRADDERHLRLLLDEVGNTDAAIWEEYDGPLWIELEPKWRRTETGEIELADDHFDVHTQPWDVLEPGPAGDDTLLATFWTILASRGCSRTCTSRCATSPTTSSRTTTRPRSSLSRPSAQKLTSRSK